MPKRILFAAGDPGGANAVRPVLSALAARNHPIAVLDHGGLALGLPPSVPVVAADFRFDALCFGTSLKDAVPLAAARAARDRGLPVLSILDNWVNYRSRLATDGLPPLIPDIYAVMDQKAKDEAVAEGIPAQCIAVTGHPNLASLSVDAERATGPWVQDFRQSLGLGVNGRGLAVFVNEPVTQDQGDGPHNPLWRGYTEATALAELAAGLEGAPIDVAIIPHPRDDLAQVAALWARVQGGCRGRVVAGINGRDAVLAADRVAGMASILLYESWLVGRPTLSLQPGLVRDDLLSIASRPGIILARQTGTDAVRRWLAQPGRARHPDLALHAGAADVIADLLVGI